MWQALSRVDSRHVVGVAGSQQSGQLPQLLFQCPFPLSFPCLSDNNTLLRLCKNQLSSTHMILTKSQSMEKSKRGRVTWAAVVRESFEQTQELELEPEG